MKDGGSDKSTPTGSRPVVHAALCSVLGGCVSERILRFLLPVMPGFVQPGISRSQVVPQAKSYFSGRGGKAAFGPASLSACKRSSGAGVT